MAFVAALIALEKLAPWRVAANRAIAVGLLAIGLGLAIAPRDVPALTVPGSPEARDSMMRMEGGMKPENGAMPSKRAMPGNAMPADAGAMPKKQGGTGTQPMR
jgi:hypothetical protein